jgi:RNA polymerase sigma-70 factor, ECF subfamily
VDIRRPRVLESSPIGDSSASDRFEAFVRDHQDMVFGTAVRLLGGRAEAEDVAQTVFLRAFQRFDQIGDSPAAAGWLRTVTRNACLNHLARYRSRWRLFSELRRDDTADTAGIEERAVESGQSPLERLEHEETSRRLEEALRSLPDHQRVPLVLFHFERLSYQDIARALGIALAKLKTDMHRGRLALREALK